MEILFHVPLLITARGLCSFNFVEPAFARFVCKLTPTHSLARRFVLLSLPQSHTAQGLGLFTAKGHPIDSPFYRNPRGAKLSLCL